MTRRAARPRAMVNGMDLSLYRPTRKAPSPPAAADPKLKSARGKLFLACKAGGLDEEDRRALVKRVTGKDSLSLCTLVEVGQVLDELAKQGIEPGGKKSRAADHPSARKARAMLISLNLLGVIRNASEGALEAFARRQLGVERLQWADQSQMYKLIEALKAIATRHGWDQDVAGIAEPVRELKLRLCAAILGKLKARGAATPEATLHDVVRKHFPRRFGSFDTLTDAELNRLASTLGAELATVAATEAAED